MALSPRAAQSAASVDVEYRQSPPAGRRIGIALSGGGFRSAAFNLGALQALQEEKILGSADYLAAVSGGNYIASALMISEAYTEPECENGKPLWSHGSPEERHLRLNTNFLAPGFVGRTWLVLSVVYGFVLNYLPFLLCAFIIGRLLGWLAYWKELRLSDMRLRGLTVPSSDVVTVMLAMIGGLLLLAVIVVAVRRFSDGRFGVRDFGKTRAEPIAAVLVALAGLFVGLLVLPPLAGLYGRLSELVLTGIFGESSVDFQMAHVRVLISGLWLLLMILLAAAALALSRHLRARRSMLALSAVAAGGLLLVPLLSSLDYSASHGTQSMSDVLGLVAAVAIVLLMAVLVHNRRYSMHLFYRERLSSAFALERFRDDDGNVAVKPRQYNEPLNFSECGERLSGARGARLPKLIVCCAANVTSAEVPVGRFAESFTFEHDISGGPRFGYDKTKRFETLSGPKGTTLTLPSIMAVSGAALSPLMGRFTYPPLRFLMALTDVRLGVWVRNPCHQRWREELLKPTGRVPRLLSSIADGWHEPGAMYVLREAMGTLNLKKRFIYLTDGGHWENLGLVELLRRRCTDVLCFDASADQIAGGQDIGRAIALARSELGAEIDLDPTPTLPPAPGRPSQDCAVRGSIRYPDGQDARLIYAKATLPADASWDLKAFGDRAGRFPNHSTSQQVFTDEQFEAYRSLGRAAAVRAIALLNIPPSHLRETGGASSRPVRTPGSNGALPRQDPTRVG